LPHQIEIVGSIDDEPHLVRAFDPPAIAAGRERVRARRGERRGSAVSSTSPPRYRPANAPAHMG
jgi:hypothetical protein